MNPEIYITGMKHTGTTFMTRMFEQLEFDSAETMEFSEAHGAEWEPWADVAKRAGDEYGADPHPDHYMFHGEDFDSVNLEKKKELWDKYSGEAEGLDYPEVVKYPDMNSHFLIPAMNPTLVVLMHRDPEKWFESLRFYSYAERLGRTRMYNIYAHSFGLIVNELLLQDQDFVIVKYPLIAQDEDYCFDVFAKINEYVEVDLTLVRKAFRKIANPNLINRKKV